MGTGSDEPLELIGLPTPRRPDAPPPARRFSPAAIASIVLPLLFPFAASIVSANANASWINALLIAWAALPIAGLICGITALVKIHSSAGALRGTGLAVAGTTLSALGTLLVLVLLIGGA